MFTHLGQEAMSELVHDVNRNGKVFVNVKTVCWFMVCDEHAAIIAHLRINDDTWGKKNSHERRAQ